jgi:hypothetical protein
MRHAAALLAAALLSGCAAMRTPPPAGSARPATAPDPAPASGPAASGPLAAAMSADDRTRLAEAFRLAAAVGDRVWASWSEAPFAVLLVTPEREFLVRHPRPSAEFTRVGYDSLLGGELFVRPRVLSPTLLATFPAVGGVSTIVIGPAALTGKSSTAWVLTVLHEHFHQLQTSRPDYYAGVEALGLARGDQTGMWMLNYPFPYDTAVVRARFADFATQLQGAITPQPSSLPSPERAVQVRAVAAARERLRAVLPADDDRYLAFQMWQEGIARYTELQVARVAATGYTPTQAFRALPDFREFGAMADSLERELQAELRGVDLARMRRVAFYPAGAATALLLDAAVPAWRSRYFAHPFSLDAHLR